MALRQSSGQASSSPVVKAGAPKLTRRTFVIDRGFQLKYTVSLAAVGAGVSALFGAMMYLAHADAAKNLALPPQMMDAWTRNDPVMIGLTGAMTILMAVALGLFGVLITHRVAGPVYVMSHYVSVLASGRYPKMRPLRKNDELKDFFDRFQSAVESLRQREAAEVHALELALGSLEPLVGQDPQGQAAIGELRALRERKKTSTSSP